MCIYICINTHYFIYTHTHTHIHMLTNFLLFPYHFYFMDKLLEDGFTILSLHNRTFSGTMADFRKLLETPFNFGMNHRPPPYPAGGYCLLCSRVRKDSSFLESGVKTVSKLALSMVPKGNSMYTCRCGCAQTAGAHWQRRSATVASTSRRFCCFE